MQNIYTAVTKQDEDWWIGWIEEVHRGKLPGADERRPAGKLEGNLKGST